MEDKDLIKKFLNGETNEAETQRVNLFMQRPEAQRLFDVAWEETDPHMNTPATSPQVHDLLLKRWKKDINERIAGEKSALAKDRTENRRIYRYAAAAIILLLLSVGGYTLIETYTGTENTVTLVEVNNPGGRNRVVTLPDNSKVWLGPGSTLNYPEQFNGDTRELSLSGEAFFDVTKDPGKPFIIRTGEIYTKVLGTSFKIEAFEGSAPIVSVSTGKVKVERAHEGEMKELATLVPGEQVVWDPKHNKAVKTVVDKIEVLEWKEGKQVFNDVPLQEITKVLERWYGMKITISDPDLKEMHLYTSLTNGMPIEKIMEVLAATGGFQYEIKGKTITIRKNI